MICSNSLFHGDEDEMNAEQDLLNELIHNDDEDFWIDDWKLSKID